jgi:hypothetical protein
LNPDIVNGLFELAGSAFLLLNVRQLHRDKELNGVHWLPTLFFSTWGVWNLYFYPSLGQWFSFFGGLAIVVVNTLWLAQIAYYARLNSVKNKVKVDNFEYAE